MSNLATAVQRYLDETLGISMPGYQPWERANELPYFLQDAFDFWEAPLLGQQIVLAMDRSPSKASIGEIKLRLDKVSTVAGQRAVYVRDALASYERKRLIEQKVPFIVPGNQLYLPDLGIDLREYFRQRPSTTQSPLSPSAQAMLITIILRTDWDAPWYPSETAAALGYTPMTLSRTVRELTTAGIASVHKAGRTQYLNMVFPRQETWERIKPLLRSPVQRTIWITDDAVDAQQMRLAGLSALAHHSMLAAPKQLVYAVNRAKWHPVNASMENPGPMTGYIECQLWNYSPALQPDSDTVDPLSLTLSLQDSHDERVQGALGELRREFPW